MTHKHNNNRRRRERRERKKKHYLSFIIYILQHRVSQRIKIIVFAVHEFVACDTQKWFNVAFAYLNALYSISRRRQRHPNQKEERKKKKTFLFDNFAIYSFNWNEMKKYCNFGLDRHMNESEANSLMTNKRMTQRERGRKGEGERAHSLNRRELLFRCTLTALHCMHNSSIDVWCMKCMAQCD